MPHRVISQKTTTMHVDNNKTWQCKYKGTMRCVRETTLTVENQYVLHILNVCLWPQVSSVQCECGHIVIRGLSRSAMFVRIISCIACLNGILWSKDIRNERKI